MIGPSAFLLEGVESDEESGLSGGDGDMIVLVGLGDDNVLLQTNK